MMGRRFGALVCLALGACGTGASGPPPVVASTCTADAVRAYARAVPQIRLGRRRDAASDLVRMAEMDQCVRSLDEPAVGLDLVHGAELARFLDRFGWPTSNTWPSEVVDAAFLLAQHSPDVALQERVLAAIASSIERDPGAARHHAYLHDRIQAVRKGLPQRFGTQGRCLERGQWEPLPIEDRGGVDDRRRAAGLPPLAAYVQEMSSRCSNASL